MSLAHLLIAARNQLHADLGIDSSSCDIQEDEQPDPKWGGPGFYLAIYGTEWVPGPNPNQHLGIDEVMGFAVCITKRSGWVPKHRIGDQIYTKDESGILAIARAVMASLIPNCITVMGAANALINPGADPTPNKFVEPYIWAGNDPAPIAVGPDWFASDPAPPPLSMKTSINASKTVNYGHKLNVRFGGARRLQTFENVT